MIPKFRGLSIDEKSKGEWQYGHLIEDSGRAFIINEVIEANEQYITIGFWDPVRPDTVSQSTGLKDKNGKEIFEGDIFTNGIDVMSMKRHGTLGFYIDFKGKIEFLADGADLEEFEEDTKEIANSIKIIGNIYENPELLEVTE